MKESVYVQYADKLSAYTKAPMIMLCIVFGILIIGTLVAIKFHLFKDVWVYLALGVVVLVCGYFLGVYPYQKDIKAQAYQEYTGNFYVEKYHYVTNSGVHIHIRFPDSEKTIRYRAPGDLQGIENGNTYYGRFVWGEKSKGIVDFSIEKRLE